MNNDKRVAQIRHYAKQYQAAKDNGLDYQAKLWLKRYEQAVKILGFDPLA